MARSIGNGQQVGIGIRFLQREELMEVIGDCTDVSNGINDSCIVEGSGSRHRALSQTDRRD